MPTKTRRKRGLIFRLEFKRKRGGIESDYKSKHWYGLVNGKRVRLATDKDVARQVLGEKIREAERRKNGLIDRFAAPSKTPLTEHIDKFREHLEAKGSAPRYVTETIRNLRLITRGKAFLRDVTADRVNRYLRDLEDRGRSPATLNSYLTAAKNFCQFCVRTARLPDNPLAHLSKRNEEVDRRRERRTSGADEFARLISTTENSSVIFRRLTGEDRAVLYLTAVGAGLRAAELASLTLASLALEGDAPTITVNAAFSKRRRRDEQPIPQ